MLLVPLAGIYLALAFYQIDNQSLWTDEVISLNAAANATPSSWLNSQCPLYYGLLRVWTKAAGTTEFSLRALSAILGLVAVCLIYFLGLELFNRRTAAVSALLLATSPFFIWYSQEVRYINLMLVTSLLATYTFHRAISDDRLGWWISYGISSILAAFSFVSVIFLLMAHGLYLIWSRSGRTPLSKWLLCQIIMFTIFGAWFVAQYGGRLGPDLTKAPASISIRHVPGQQMQRTFDLAGAIPYTFFAFSTGFSLGPSVRELHIARSPNTLLSNAHTVLPVAVPFAILFVVGLGVLRQNRRSAAFLLSWLTVPIISVFLVAALTSFGVYNVRYAASALPAYLLILAAGIYALQPAKLQIALLALVLMINAASLSQYYFNTRYARADTRSAAGYVTTAAHPRDILVVVGSATSLRHYYKGDLPIVGADGRNTETWPAVANKLRELGNKHDRLWLLEIRPWESDPQGRVKAALDSLARQVDNKTFPGVEVHVYDFADPSP